MNTINNRLFIISRPDILGIYAKIIARIGETSNFITQEEDLSLIAVAQQPTRYETVYLENGAEGIIKLVCQDLLHLGFIEIRDDVLRVATYFRKTSHLEPIEQVIFDYLHVPKTKTELKESKVLQKAIAPYCQTYRQSLINKGYLRSDNEKYFTVGIVGLAILASTTFKPISVILASYRYLILPAVVVMPKASLAIAATAWFSSKSKSSDRVLTAKGKKHLKNR